MKKIIALLTMAVLTVTFSRALALPPTQAPPPLHVMTTDFQQIAAYWDEQAMINPITVYSDGKMDIYVFENFVKTLHSRPPLPTDEARAFKAPWGWKFSQTGNFSTVLYYEIKDEGMKKFVIDSIRKKIKRRNEFEQQGQKYQTDISEGKPVGPTPHADMMDYFVSTFQRQTLEGMPKNAELLKWIKETVYFDIQRNKMIELKVVYIDQNAQVIGYIAFQNEIDLNSDQMLNGLGHKIAAMLQQTAGPAPPSPQMQTNSLQNPVLQKYYADVWERIQESWHSPSLSVSKNLLAVVSIRIRKDGKIANWTIEHRSGNRSYDESIIRALQSIDALPPLPVSLNVDHLDVGFNFHSPQNIASKQGPAQRDGTSGRWVQVPAESIGGQWVPAHSAWVPANAAQTGGQAGPPASP